MTSIFFGGIKNLLHDNHSLQNTVQRITQNLGKSNLGVHRGTANAYKQTSSPKSSTKDSFDIAEHISELLSPACGMTEEEKEAYFNKIIGKLKSGTKLSPEEMRFLQAKHPELYQQTARVQAMRDGLETRLKTATSKQKAQEIFADSLSHVSDGDPMKEYVVAAYHDAMKNFEKSDEYKDLPQTEEDAKREDNKQNESRHLY
ncbi:MAG: hypothetical protein IKW08_01420 [Roseburia sp.]|nr:hypothetical protein [Roseburia sp.]